MKLLIKRYLANVLTLWLVQQLIVGFVVTGGWQTLLIVALGLSILNLIVRPLLKILLLPINLLSLGLFGWVINVVILYLLSYFFPQVTIHEWHFTGISVAGIRIPSMQFGIIPTYIIVSFALGIVGSFINWL